MAKLIIDNQEFEVPDGSAILKTCEEGGVPFGCQNGDCGTCQIEIYEGAENLMPLNAKEEAMAMDKHNRLACQCVIKHGTVRIGF